MCLVWLTLPTGTHRISKCHPAGRKIRQAANGTVAFVDAAETYDFALMLLCGIAMQKLPLAIMVVEDQQNWELAAEHTRRSIRKRIGWLRERPITRQKRVSMFLNA